MNVVWELTRFEKCRVVTVAMVPPNSSIIWFYEKELEEEKEKKEGRKQERKTGEGGKEEI